MTRCLCGLTMLLLLAGAPAPAQTIYLEPIIPPPVNAVVWPQVPLNDYDQDNANPAAEDADGDATFGTMNTAIALVNAMVADKIVIPTSGLIMPAGGMWGNIMWPVVIEAAPGVDAVIDLGGMPAGTNGFTVVTPGPVTFRNLTILRAPFAAIFAQNGNVVVEGCTLLSCNIGVLVNAYPAKVTVDHCVISKMYGSGIEVAEGGRLQVENSQITFCGGAGIGVKGLDLIHTTKADIRGTYIAFTDVGVLIEDPPAVAAIYDCDISFSVRHGIWLYDLPVPTNPLNPLSLNQTKITMNGGFGIMDDAAFWGGPRLGLAYVGCTNGWNSIGANTFGPYGPAGVFSCDTAPPTWNTQW